eukprot:3206723-Amphidinium_carterae.1
MRISRLNFQGRPAAAEVSLVRTRKSECTKFTLMNHYDSIFFDYFALVVALACLSLSMSKGSSCVDMHSNATTTVQGRYPVRPDG